jgi:hypothetical protein
MKTLSLLLAFVMAASMPAFAGAKKPRAGKGKAAKHALALRQIDQNKNHQIDGAEIDVLKQKFAAAPADSRLKKRIDQNSNGQLDDQELQKLNKRFAKRAEHQGKKASGKKAERKGKKKSAAQ